METPTDTELINWLNAQGSYYRWTVQIETDYPFVKRCVFVQRNSTEGEPDIRTAIIKAMQRQQQTKN
jgi:hypothetical protein